jgi:hypothetical protein
MLGPNIYNVLLATKNISGFLLQPSTIGSFMVLSQNPPIP